ncbi:hypothetical protein [Halobellus rufus]|uniref:hypothetical protein n=1 Tax=Halobellus rufus TaxID=1448860 RepID=UPI0006785528|nr:hypothetical protein [Halobellus rufus]
MLRTVLSAICAIEVLKPEALIAAAERIALENPDDCDRRSWVNPGARLEGLVVLAAMWRSDESYTTFKRFLGVVGLLALLFPRAYVNYGGALAYAEASEPEWKPWVYAGTRAVGFVYVCVALSELRGVSVTNTDD